MYKTQTYQFSIYIPKRTFWDFLPNVSCTINTTALSCLIFILTPIRSVNIDTNINRFGSRDVLRPTHQPVMSDFLSFSSFSAIVHIKCTYISLRVAAPSAGPFIPAIMIIAKFIEKPFLINEQSQSSKTPGLRDRGDCILRKTSYYRSPERKFA